MTLDGILPFARLLLEKTVLPGSAAVDATAGNGHDTLFLARLTGESGRVFAFDVQKQAIENTCERLKKSGASGQVSLFHAGHETAARLIPPEFHGNISAAVFNLGYLPQSDKSVITKPDTTIEAINQLLGLLKPGGLIVLVVYHGHTGGGAERDAVLQYAAGLDQQIAHVARYEFLNQINHPPFIIAIEKR